MSAPSLPAGRRPRDEGEATVGSRPRPWIGVDFSEARRPRRTRSWLPLLALALIAALGVVALRIDLIRTRYALAAALAEEQALLEEQRALIVRRRQLRDPGQLAIQARERGFRPPARVLVLDEPALATEEPRLATEESPRRTSAALSLLAKARPDAAALPAVAAGPAPTGERGAIEAGPAPTGDRGAAGNAQDAARVAAVAPEAGR